MKFPVFAFFLAFLMLGAVSFASINIDNCTELNETGETYFLTADIMDSEVSQCMDITADNVSLDCQGYLIDGIGSTDSDGIFADGSITAYSNITIKNCMVAGWMHG